MISIPQEDVFIRLPGHWESIMLNQNDGQEGSGGNDSNKILNDLYISTESVLN